MRDVCLAVDWCNSHLILNNLPAAILDYNWAALGRVERSHNNTLWCLHHLLVEKWWFAQGDTEKTSYHSRIFTIKPMVNLNYIDIYWTPIYVYCSVFWQTWFIVKNHKLNKIFEMFEIKSLIVWSMISDVWTLISDIWTLISELLLIDHDLWTLIIDHDIWCLNFCSLTMIYDIWYLNSDHWPWCLMSELLLIDHVQWYLISKLWSLTMISDVWSSAHWPWSMTMISIFALSAKHS